jgi:hypothetical protein
MGPVPVYFHHQYGPSSCLLSSCLPVPTSLIPELNQNLCFVFPWGTSLFFFLNGLAVIQLAGTGNMVTLVKGLNR